MQLETFRGRDLAAVDAQARSAFGEEAMILRTLVDASSDRAGIAVLAAPATEFDRFARLLAPDAALDFARAGSRRPRGARPRIVALVGPTGAGKTTTLAKLATSPMAFGDARVGLLTLDTHRAAGFEQLQAYADAAGLPCAVAYDAAEAASALRGFSDCDVVLIDTAGRAPANEAQAQRAAALLASLRVDEVHLVVPATLRHDLLAPLRDAYRQRRVTHALLTKLDEVPADHTLATMTAALDLPMRWITDGQDVPRHLRTAAPEILRPLGLAARAGVAA
ncbi:MAG: flagellar biosynthesis protein FlhF [Gemmatimonadaceae bacterium]